MGINDGSNIVAPQSMTVLEEGKSPYVNQTVETVMSYEDCNDTRVKQKHRPTGVRISIKEEIMSEEAESTPVESHKKVTRYPQPNEAPQTHAPIVSQTVEPFKQNASQKRLSVTRTNQSNQLIYTTTEQKQIVKPHSATRTANDSKKAKAGILAGLLRKK